MAVCTNGNFSNLTQYASYQIIDSSGSQIKIIDDGGVVIWVEVSIFHVR